VGPRYSDKLRFRDYGWTVGELPTGPTNHLQDVPGVRVGHVTLNVAHGYPGRVQTGVTAILPHAEDWFTDKVCAVSHVINGFGKTTGLVQVDELGELESPILLTNTFSVPAVTEGALRYMMAQNPEIGDFSSSLNIVVGECNDSYLNDMRGLHVRAEDAMQAIDDALVNPSVAEGCVGAGAGMRCYGWKGGIGSASRQVTILGQVGTIGILVLTNFGASRDLTVLDKRVGQAYLPPVSPPASEQPDGSVMVVLATDLPFEVDQLKRLSKRVPFGLARTGSIAHNGSGDVVIGFSTTSRKPPVDALQMPAWFATRQALRDGAVVSECFRAVVEATEEAVLNSLCAAVTTAGRRGRRVTALPMGEIHEWMMGSGDG